MSVVLYNPVSNASAKRVLPFSILALGAVLEGRRDYELVDGNLEGDAAAALVAAVDGGARVVGMTVMPGPQLENAVEVARRLRAARPQAVLVWGGYFPTEHPRACLESGLVDFVVRGHGEAPFLNLLELLDGPDPRSAAEARVIEGLGYRARGELRIGGVARVPNVAELPDFPFHRLSMGAYPRDTFLGRRTLGYHSSYGCPFLCNFCGVVSLARGRWNAQPPETVERNLRRYAGEWGVDAVEFYDNNFFTHEARCVEIARRTEPLRLAWWGEGRIDTLLKFSDDSWRAMTASGLRMIFLGAESGSAETLRRMDKGGTLGPGMTLALASRMKAFGVVPEFSFVLGNPPDPERDVEETLAFVRLVKERHPEAEIVLYQYTPVPVEGDLLQSATSSGFAFPKTLDEWVSDPWRDIARRNSDRLPWLTPRLKRRISDFRRVLNAFHPTSTDRRLAGWKRSVLRSAAGWRYRWDVTAFPLELVLLQRWLKYQRPETAGF